MTEYTLTERRTKLLDRIADAFRKIGQPDITNLIFVCDAEDEFAQLGDTILGIPVYTVPFLSVRGGLLLACKDVGWTKLGRQLLDFQEEMEV